MLIPFRSFVTMVVLDRSMVDLCAVVLPLVHYDMFYWREDNFLHKSRKDPDMPIPKQISSTITEVSRIHLWQY